jgi:serine/threonine protein kinase
VTSAAQPETRELLHFADLDLQHRSEWTSVYSAREEQTGRSVVLKVVDAEAPEFVHEALDREAGYLALLGTHPNIVTLYQRTTLPDQRAALVLESCSGTIGDAVSEGRINVPTAVSIAIKIAGSLETMHRAGLIHAAVGPQSVLLTEFGEPVLAEFGSTAAVGGGVDASLPGLQVPTPHTAPELLLGEAPTPATDVYGLTSMLYEMIVGKPAFRAYDRESPAAVSLRILAGGVHPIVSPDVPLELSDLVVWGLTADPTERPPGAAWLAEELGRIEAKNGWLRTRMVTGEPRLERRRRKRFFS